MKKRIYLLAILVSVTFINFLIFGILTVKLGGDALNGFTKGGKYFVASHGNIKEVSKTMWIISRYQAYSIFITVFSTIIGSLLTYNSYIKNKDKLQ